MSIYFNISKFPHDPILGLTEEFNKDPRKIKLNLGVGVYLDEDGKIPVLNSVAAASNIIFDLFKNRGGYLPIGGVTKHTELVKTLLLGAERSINSHNKLTTVQALGGTGGLRLGAELLKRVIPSTSVYISNPSWENHRNIFEAAGFPVKEYPYYNPENNSLNMADYLDTLRHVPSRSVIVLHACCHNPTGIDPSKAQWTEILNVFKEKGHIPFLDLAYQGFNGTVEEDAEVVRLFSESLETVFIANSFSKNMSLYGERIGACTVSAANTKDQQKILSHLKNIIRGIYSSPPSFGQQIVSQILEKDNLRNQWEEELKHMRSRIVRIRNSLFLQLQEKNLNLDLSFIKKQKGMFSYSGLSAQHVDKLKYDYGIYVLSSGRICMAAINDSNLEYVAESIASVLEGS
ncbi:MAG: aromatic amino acid aminotransferase [Betaproteobacteria bacterium TMED82]|nr:MAG: aromatic amino acid aminotransferase [Betaproteobacteria bacterium TMED82]|tara:strand:+ start:16424 stop:17632 length:1209 start_codon:yes stop_codon:yes gene_type:complete